MNFNDLYKKIAQLDEQSGITSPTDTPLMGEEGVSECGDMMPHPVATPKQQDNVTMNVSMNGSGAGGIKDLMQILRNIETGGETHDHDALFGNDEEGEVDEEFGGFGDASTTPNTVTLDINAVTPTGNDLASKGAEAEKVNGGGNPFNVDESLVSRLSAMYEEIKESHQADTTMKHVKNPTAGEKKAAKDIKPGIKGYKDRVDMLKSAEKDGRLDEYGTDATPGIKPDTNKVMAAQQDLVSLIKELNPKADLSSYKIDGTWGPQSQQLGEYAHQLVQQIVPDFSLTPERKRFYQDKQLAAYAKLNKALKDGMVGHSGDGRAPGIRQGDKNLLPGTGYTGPTSDPQLRGPAIATPAQQAAAAKQPMPQLPETVNESADIVKLSKILNG